MAKRVMTLVLDQTLNYIKNNATQECACSAEPTTAYEAIDPDIFVVSTAYSLGAAVRPIAARNGFAYEVTTAGTSAASEPTWPTTAGNTVVSGSVTFTCRANVNLSVATTASGDYTVANGDGAGNTPRKVTTGAKSGNTIHTTGTATHVALAKKGSPTVAAELFEVTTCTSQALTSGNTLNFPAWKIEIGAPT